MRIIVLLMATAAAVIGCNADTPASQTAVQGNPYPAKASTLTANVVPTHTPPAIKVSGNPFQIETPLLEGAVNIRGRGPANLPIVMMDVTYNGEEIGKTIISADGNFTVTVAPPLERGHRIGLTVGPLEKAIVENESFLKQLYDLRGPGYIYVPTIAYFYDSTLVQAK